MNVIVSNKQKQIIDNANIDAIKDLNGLFNIDDLISKFKNYFFSKMILDATCVVDFTHQDVIEKLAKGIGSERLFILLPSSPEPPQEFIDILKKNKIYNYSTSIDELVNLIANPKVESDISSNSFAENFYVDNSVKNDNALENNFYVDNSESIINDNQKEKTIDNEIVSDNFNAFADNNGEVVNNVIENNDINADFYSNDAIEENVDTKFYNNQENKGNYILINNARSDENNNKKIIGFKNVTSHAGSTELIYMLVKNIISYGKSVVAFDINKNDFKYYQEKNFISCGENEIKDRMKNSKVDIILVDVNECHDTSFCTDVIYLVEPSIIKLNTVMINNPFTFRDLRGKKVVLNKSFLSNSDVSAISKEAGVEMFYNIPPLNDRINNSVLDKFLKLLDLI